MRTLLTLLFIFLTLPHVKAQQDAFSLRVGPEIGAGLGYQWGSDIDYNNGLLSGGLMFEGRMANAWGWALRPAYARSVALDKELGNAFGEHRFQLLTGPVWRADNGRTMRAYARTAPFVRLLGGAMAHTDINRRNLLPMAELGLGLKFRLNDRNDLEVALAAQGAGTSQKNLQLAGILSLAYHINFKERKIKFRSPPLNLVPRTTESEVTRNDPSWENPLLPSRGIEWSPQIPETPKKRKQRNKQQPKDEDVAISPSSSMSDEAALPSVESLSEPEIEATAKTSPLPSEQTEERITATEPKATDKDTVTAEVASSESPEEMRAAPATTSEPSTTVSRTDTVIKVMEVEAPPQPANKAVPASPAAAQSTQAAAPAQAPQPVTIEVRTTPSAPVSQAPVPVAVGIVPTSPANDDAIARLAQQQEQMMAMLQQLNRSVELLSQKQATEVMVSPAIVPSPQAQPTAPDQAENDDLRAQLANITNEMSKMAERMTKLEQQMTQPQVAEPVVAPAPVVTEATAPQAQPGAKPSEPGKVVGSEQATVKSDTQAGTAAPSKHEVQFARNSYGLNAEQADVIRAMAARALEDPKLMVVVEGYADRSGPADFNAIIARKRANEVLYELKKLGVPIAQTVFASYGDERSMDDPSYRKVVVRLMRTE